MNRVLASTIDMFIVLGLLRVIGALTSTLMDAEGDQTNKVATQRSDVSQTHTWHSLTLPGAVQNSQRHCMSYGSYNCDSWSDNPQQTGSDRKLVLPRQHQITQSCGQSVRKYAKR